MKDYSVIAKRYSIIIAVLIFLFLIVALITKQTELFLGLALGASFSLINLMSTYLQVKRIGNSIKDGKAKFSFGTVSRILTAVFAVYIAMSFPEYFNLMGVIIGLMATYVLILIEPIYHIKRLQ